MKTKFSCEVVNLARFVLQLHIDKHNNTELDKSKRLASNDMIYNSMTQSEIEELLDRLVVLNNDDVLFKEGSNDSEKLWKMIWGSDEYKSKLNEYVCQGMSGTGVFDILTNQFYPCNYSEHYETIRKILEASYPKLWDICKKFDNGEDVCTSEVDNFIMGSLVLVGSKYGDSYYTLNEKK